MKSPSLSPASWPRWVRAFAFGALFGVIGYGVGGWLANVAPGGFGLTDKAIRWSDVLAMAVGAALVLGSLLALYISLNAKRLGQMYNLEGDASPDEMSLARFQAAVMGFSGVILALPVVFSLMGVSPVLGVGAIVLLLVLHTVMNVRIYRQADELLRRAVLETAAVTFFAGQLILFVWAAAERLGAAPPITAWDIYTVLMTLYLGASIWISARRGLA
jgi:predicted histidine transporter YuiF (NhaC family)